MTWPDPVALLQPLLFAAITPVPVSSQVPNPRPVEFVQFRRVGGPKRPPVRDQPRLDVICWAATEPRAMALALTLRSTINALHGTTTASGLTVYTVEEFLGPRQLDDPLTGSPRVLATYSLLIRADDAIR